MRLPAFKPFARGSAAFLPLPHCFEVLGFDLALDRTGELFLLEVNSGPDLSLHGARLAADLDRLLSDVLSVTNRHLYRGEPAQGAAAALRPLLNTDTDASAACAAPAAAEMDPGVGSPSEATSVLQPGSRPAADCEIQWVPVKSLMGTPFERVARLTAARVGSFAYPARLLRGAQAKTGAMEPTRVLAAADGDAPTAACVPMTCFAVALSTSLVCARRIWTSASL